MSPAPPAMREKLPQQRPVRAPGEKSQSPEQTAPASNVTVAPASSLNVGPDRSCRGASPARSLLPASMQELMLGGPRAESPAPPQPQAPPVIVETPTIEETPPHKEETP